MKKCSMNSLPSSISELKHLRYLNLSYSKIITLPKSIIYLQNLQTLILLFCHELHKLPKDMKQMKELRYLDIRGCNSLTNLPAGIGQMENVKLYVRLNRFSRIPISELRGLNLCGVFELNQLENISNYKDAEDVNLKSQKHLYELSLNWQVEDDKSGSIQADIDTLKPHPDLKILSIFGYQGSELPDWLSKVHLNNLVRIYLLGCRRCEVLPPLETLLSLKVLHISGMHSVKYIVTEGSDERAELFPALEELVIEDLQSLMEWTTPGNKGVIFLRLRDAKIRKCPKLINYLQHFHSSLNRLTLQDVQLENLPEDLQRLKALQKLEINGCSNLINLPNLPCLTDLTVSRFRGESLPNDMQHLNGLQNLQISNCRQLSSLPNCLGSLQSLSSLCIYMCPKLTGLPEGMKNSTTLQIHICRCLRVCICPHLATPGED